MAWPLRIGRSTVGGSSATLVGDQQFLNKYTLPTPRSTLLTGYIRLDGLGSGAQASAKVKMTVYALDGSGLPGALLAVSNEVTVLDNAAASDLAFTFNGDIIEAQDVWLGIFVDGAGVGGNQCVRAYQDTGPSGSRRHGPDTYSDGPLNPGNFTSSSTPLYTIYLDYIPEKFDPAKHHVGLGPTGQQAGLILTGAYNEERQQANSLIAKEYGSEDDLLAPVPSLSRLTQDDFTGGVFQRTWGKDPAMVNSSKGMVPTQLDRSARTIPPMRFFVANTANFLQAASTAVSGFWTLGGAYILVGQKDDATNNWLFERRLLTDGSVASSKTVAQKLNAVAFDREGKRVWWIEGTSAPFAAKYLDATDFSTAVVSTGNMPAAAKSPRGLTVSASRLVAQMGPFLYSGIPNDDVTNVKWVKIGRMPGVWRDSCVYNGLVYILATDGEHKTSVVAFDGSNILPVTDFPYNFQGTCIEAYAGRLYVGGRGMDYAGADKYAELYEITGSTLRLLRTFAPDSRISGLASPNNINDLLVHEGLLFLCHSGAYLTVYDVTADAFWGGPENYTSTSVPRYLASARQKVVSWASDAGASGNAGVWRMANANGDLSGGTHTCQLVTSDFAPEPDLLKTWSKLKVRTRYAGVTAEYSTNGGQSFTSLSGSSTTVGDYRDTEFDLTAIAASKQIQFRFSFARTDVDSFTEFVSYTLQFASVNTGKLGWVMTVAAVQYPENVVGDRAKMDYTTLRTQLIAWANAGTVLDYTDIHNETYKVYIYDIRNAVPVIPDRDSAGKRELFINLTLVEV